MNNSLIILLLFPMFVIGQMPLDKALKKMDLKESEVVRSNENIALYPRGFIYALNNPDSVAYFGCISTDRKSFKQYFENAPGVIMRPTNTVLLRGSGDHVDSISFESLEILSDKLMRQDSATKPIVDPEADYIVIYYWHKDIIDNSIIKNYKYFRKYSSEHPELKIQLIAVLNE